LYDGKDINSWQFYALEVNSKKSENYDNLKSILKSDLKSPIFVGHDAYKMSEDMLIIIAWHTKISALEYSKIKMLPKNNRRGSDASFKPLKSPNLCFLR
jgi:hypothetical protein